MATKLSVPSHEQGSGLSRKLVWGGMTAVVISLVLVFGFLYFCFKRKLYANCKLCPRQKGKLEARKLMLRQFHYEELQKATNNFSTECLVGKGAFGNVYRGQFDVEGTLAIKILHPSSSTSIEEFRNEVRLISTVKHQNLVGLVGFCEQPGSKGAKALIYEYVSNGSLLDYISGRGGMNLTWRQRVNIAIGAAKGIGHLHEGITPSIIHRDIKPSNILVGANFETKVSDFGLAKAGPVGDLSHVSSQVKGTPGYLDPAYCASFHLSPFTDVFSFGVILLQLVTARPAVDSSGGHHNVHIIKWARPSLERGRVEEIIDANLIMDAEECNMEMMLKMGQIGLRCVVGEPKKRPTMTQVCQELEAALRAVDDPPPLCLVVEARSEGVDQIGQSDFQIGPFADLIQSAEGAADPSRHKQPTDPDLKWWCNIIKYLPKQPSLSSQTIEAAFQELIDSESSINVDDIGLQKFYLEMESFSFGSAKLRCLESDSVKIEVEEFRGIDEAKEAQAWTNYMTAPR